MHPERHKALKELWELVPTLKNYPHTLHEVQKKNYIKTTMTFCAGARFILIKYSWPHKDEYYMTQVKHFNYDSINSFIKRLKH